MITFGGNGSGASLLIVDDEPPVTRALARMLRRYGACTAALSAAEATRHLTNRREWNGFVIDVGLSDGSGLDLLADARRLHKSTPAIIVSGRLDHDAINRAAALNARFLCKPCGLPELAPFLSDVLLHARVDRARAATERARHRWHLSPREAQILNASLRGRTKGDFLHDTEISVNTYKTHVRKLLEKADYQNLSTLAIDLLREP